MPAPRLSQSAEAAKAAALQAEFNEKKWVWVPDDREGYLAGWVNKEENDIGEIVMAAGGEIRRVPLYALSKMNPPKFDRVDDIADLTFLNEASVVHNLRLRYGSGAIYTYSGLFLVAINPYQSLPLYSDSIIHQYRNKRRDENPPHIFAVAERAWVNMGEERENQSILITGESGAGKTESTKKVIQYLAAIATDVHPPTPSVPNASLSSSSLYGSSIPSIGLPRSSSLKGKQSATATGSGGSHLKSKDRLGLLERQILQANPILEAFGNAQTQRNSNSSRFGKFVRISFAPDGSIAGANIDWYLLEKSRVVVRSNAERSFHVFYQLMASGDSLKDTLLLDGGVEDYEYLNKSRREVDGVDDREEWSILKTALNVVGFTQAEQLDLFRVVAAILHVGNITVTSTRSDDAVLPDPSQAERVCHLLGLPVQDFVRAVLRPRVLAGREWVSQARTRQQALDELSALCKTLYEKAFGQLVERINRALDRPSAKSTFIGVLDIAGFEIFEINAFEQLLINYTNEKLQQFFNHHMFVLEQEEYAREGIEWDYVNFGLDLQPTIDLIEASGNVIGILSCLDEECIMPKANDLTFTNKLCQMWSGDLQPKEEPHLGRSKYEPTRFEQGFIIQHYAGKVEYRTDGWLEKNKDPLNDNLTRVLSASSDRYISSLFAEFSDSITSSYTPAGGPTIIGKKRIIKKGAFRTAAQRHKEQLSSLMSQLQATQPHFVRCIVPNGNKKAGRVDVPLILDQLRCNGVLEGIRIARLGYPNRLPFVEFRQRYEVLTPGIIPRGYMDGRKACLRMVDALELDRSFYRVGTSKIFFKAGVLADLEERRDSLLFDVFSRLQATARMWTARRQMKKILNRAVAVRTIQRNARVYGDLKGWPWWQLYTKIRPLLAATRNDEELQRKELELALVKERAERDKQERDALETLKMTLETEKRKIEAELEAERVLALDKDALLERSKKRESELEEEVSAMQTDLDTLDSQLDRALKIQRESEEKYENLRQAFDQAAEHLVRFEGEQQEWAAREQELAEQLSKAEAELEALHADRDELQKVGEELKNLVSQGEEDLSRAKGRTENVIAELEGKLNAELLNRESAKSKADALEYDIRRTKEQLAEMARTASDYSATIKRKEDDMNRVTSDLVFSKQERNKLAKEIIELQGAVNTLTAELEVQSGDLQRDSLVRAKLQEELDELRALMEAKTSEETRRSEVEKRKEEELTDLRSQVGALNHDLSEARHLSLENQNKIKIELDKLVREYSALQRSHLSLSNKERDCHAQLKKTETSLSEAERAKRSVESELQALRSRQIDSDNELAELRKSKETLDRQLVTAQSKYQEFEDTLFQLERDKSSHDRQLETVRGDLATESAKRAHLEQLVSGQKADVIRLKDRATKLERELNKALTDLKAREWEVKQLESRQDKTIVEHVHVLEEAKRVTDRQLEAAQEELKKNAVYIRSLEKAKSRLTGEAEDLTRETERERAELRAKEKAAKSQEEKVSRAMADADKERRSREATELNCRRLQADLKSTQSQVVEIAQQLSRMQRSKDNLETELARVADETETSYSSTKVQRQYEARIEQLELQLEEAHSRPMTTTGIKEQMGRHHTEIRRLLLSSSPHDDTFRKRVLRELELADQQLQRGKFDHPRKLHDGGRESSDADVIYRLTEQLEDEREQHQKDLADRDLAADQTRKKYQTELARINEELQSQRDSVSRLREDNRIIHSDYDDLQLRYDNEVYNTGAWKKDKERMETKFGDLQKTYEAATAAQTEQHSQILALQSQVRELRGVLNDAETDRTLLQKARRALQAELASIKLDHVDTNKVSSERDLQKA